MIIQIILMLILLYVSAGIVFAIAFVIRGAQVIDEGAKGGSIGFRMMIFPGCIIFWPVLLRKWKKAIQAQNHNHDQATQA
jgi:hypothetical protein